MTPVDDLRARSVRAVVATALIALIASVLTFVTPSSADAAELPPSILEGGFIISDAEFFDGDSLTAAQIQTFLNGKVATCKATTGPTCLKSFTTNLPAKAADKYCKAVAAKNGATAAEVIAAVGIACGINPKVILVTMQKEQGLVTSTAPSDWSYRAAMGMSCPDTAPCDAAAAGFVNQVYLGARQQQVYALNPNSFNYRAGQVNTIKWAPDDSCGTSKVYIQNQATANLYIYTPYRPNVGALAAGYGTGGPCASYGVRNFYNYYVDWFAPGTSASTGAPAKIADCAVPVASEIVAASGTATVVETDSLNARTAPTVSCSAGLTTLARGTTVTITGAYSGWRRATVGGRTVWLAADYLSPSSTPPASAGDVCAVPSIVTPAAGTVTVTADSLNARKAPATSCEAGKTLLPKGATATRTATYGAWWQITIGSASYWIHGDYATVATSPLTAATPTIAGTPLIGQTLTAQPGAWSPDPVTFTYQWLRGGAAIPSATAATYTLVAADAGREIAVEVTGARTGYLLTTRRSAPVAALTDRVDRISGIDRYATSAAISAQNFAPGVAVAYIANGEGTADALAAAPVAGKAGAPILLVTTTQVPATVVAELQRLKPRSIVVLGGADRISEAVKSQLAGLTTGTVQRLAGVDRYATSALISAATFSPGVGVAYIANGVTTVDALSAAPVAATGGAPVLLVGATTVPTAVQDELRRLKPGKIVILGSQPSVSDAVATTLAGFASGKVERLSGIDRYATSAAISAANFGSGVPVLYVANGVSMVDALSAAPVAGMRRAPLLVISATTVPAVVDAELQRLKPQRIVMLGDPNAIGDAVARVLHARVVL